jgi:hypothetical protein
MTSKDDTSGTSNDLQHKWYLLQGESLQALLGYLHQVAQNYSQHKLGLSPINPLRDIFMQGLMHSDDLKPFADKLGRDFSVTIKRDGVGTFFVYPLTYSSPDNDGKFYMLCPVGRVKDQNDAHFVPAGGIPLDPASAMDFQRKIFVYDQEHHTSKERLYRVFTRDPIMISDGPDNIQGGPTGVQ